MQRMATKPVRGPELLSGKSAGSASNRSSSNDSGCDRTPRLATGCPPKRSWLGGVAAVEERSAGHSVASAAKPTFDMDHSVQAVQLHRSGIAHRAAREPPLMKLKVRYAVWR